MLVDDEEIISIPFTLEGKMYAEVRKRKEFEKDKGYAELYEWVEK